MNGWTLSYEGFDPKAEGLREALCALGNGFFATRGAAPEAVADDVHYPGTYIAGGYNRLSTEIAGRVVENEDLVNMPNWLPLSFRIDGGPWFTPGTAEVLSYRQDLDLRRGILTRRLRFRDAQGRVTAVTQRRIVHMRLPHIAALQTTFVADNYSGALHVRSGIDGGVRNTGVPRYRQLRGDHLDVVATGGDGDVIHLLAQTSQSNLRVAMAARTVVSGTIAGRELRTAPQSVSHDLELELAAGEQVVVDKTVAVYTSRDFAMNEPLADARLNVERAPQFDDLLTVHVLAWDHLWKRFDIQLGDEEWAQSIVRLHIFHLLQTVSENTIDLDAGAPARGLHGEAYRGHIFWDELFIFPLLNLHLPVLTRSLLHYRVRRLPAARWAAQQEGYRGAMYPWQSGSTGREESQTYHLNPVSGRWLPDHSSLQRHINIAIAYNIWQHYEVTGSRGFLRYHGAQTLLEIARFWASIATYNNSLDRYEIKGVMGPDEYHDSYPGAERPGLDNNAYTNVMTAWLMTRALDICEVLPDDHCREVHELLHLTREELELWEHMSRRMHVPFHDGVISQFQGYGDLLELDWEDYYRRYGDIHRLDRILEAEGDSTNRYKLSKQADVLMLFYLLSPTELKKLFKRLGYRFDPARDIWRNVEYYMARTAHGSTLSRMVHSWVLARYDPAHSWELFVQALHSDVEDVQGGTTREGIHLGAMAGTVDLIQRGYLGLEARDGILWLDPAPPAELERLAFRMQYRGHKLRVQVDDDVLVLSSANTQVGPIRVGYRGRVSRLKAGDSREYPIDRPSGPREDD